MIPSDGRVLLNASLLKDLRKTRALSQEALAELCFNQQLCVSIASIKRAETGKAVLYRTARHLATIFDIALERLLTSSTQPLPPLPISGPIVQVVPDTHTADLSTEDTIRYVIELQAAFAARSIPASTAKERLERLALQFGGRTVLLSDTHLAIVFGYPRAYRSDAERCLRCAIALREEPSFPQCQGVTIQSTRWQGHYAENFLALPDRHDSEQPAPIYVEHDVGNQLSNRFAFSPALAYFPHYRLFDRTIADGDLYQPLIGRYTELRLFKSIVNATEECQAGHLIYLRGMAGLGKTRLSAEFAEIARQHHIQCHSCEVLDNGADNWHAPLNRLARSLFGMTGVASADIGQTLEAVLARLKLPVEWNIFYRVLTAAEFSADQHMLYAEMSAEARTRGIVKSLQTLILRLSIRRPLLLTIEDLHWANAYLLEALGTLLTLTREAPIIWVITSRIENDPLETMFRPHLADRALTIFDLAPLNTAEAGMLADQFGEVDAAHRRRCVERAQGNPLFLTQLLSNPDTQLPDSLRHLIQSRIDGLDIVHRRALRIAAVMGNKFELQLLRLALNVPDYEPQDAGRNCLIRPCGPGNYMFVHDLVMHCIYETIEQEQRRYLHRILADLYRERDLRLCAQHLYRSGDQTARETMFQAIRAELGAFQFETALDLCIYCGKHDVYADVNFTLALLRAHASAGLGLMVQARESYQQALLLAVTPQEKLDVVVGLAAVLNILDELEEEERLLDNAIPLALAHRFDAALGRLLYLKGNICFPRGNFAEGRRLHEDATRYAQASGARETEARALSGIGDSYYAQGRMQKAHAVFSQCIDMCAQQPFLNIEASNRSALASTHIYLGQAESAIQDALSAVALSQRVGNRRSEIVSRLTAGWILLSSGKFDHAADAVSCGVELSRSLHASRFEPFLMESQARISWLQGKHILAQEQISLAAETVERLQLHQFIGPWIYGTLALLSNDSATRKKALSLGEKYLAADCVAHNAYRFLATAAEVALLEKDTSSALSYADQLARYSAVESCPWIEHHVELVRQFAIWLRSASNEHRDILIALRAQSQKLGFVYTTPFLYQKLAWL